MDLEAISSFVREQGSQTVYNICNYGFAYTALTMLSASVYFSGRKIKEARENFSRRESNN